MRCLRWRWFWCGVGNLSFLDGRRIIRFVRGKNNLWLVGWCKGRSLEGRLQTIGAVGMWTLDFCASRRREDRE